MKKKFTMYSLIFLLMVFMLMGCTAPAAQNNSENEAKEKTKGPVTVATMIDSEGAILGNMLILMLEENGFETVNKIGFGTPDILRKALEAGEVDLVIDYTGSGQYYGAEEDKDWSDPVKGYEAIKAFDKEKNNILWLSPAPANNTEMLAVEMEFAKENNLSTMYDFAKYVNDGGEVRLIASASFVSNKLGLLGYQEAYGFTLNKDQLIILSHGNTAEMLKALDKGTNNVNVSLVYGTDGSLKKMDMVVLTDPLNVPPVYLPAPVLRGEIAEQYPEIETMFKSLFEGLDLETLQTLNARVAYDGEDAKKIAEEYLTENGFLE